MSLKDRIAAQRKAIADSRASWLKAYRFKPGKTYIRILPGLNADAGQTSDEDFSVSYGAHYIKDPRDQKTILAVVGDAEICYGKADPVRDAITQFISRCNERGDEAMAKFAKSWLAKQNYVVNALILGGVDSENIGKVVPIEFSQSQYDKVLSVMDDLIAADKDPFDPADGLVLIVERVGTTVTDTEYSFSAFANPAKYPASAAHMASRHNLESYRDSKFGVSVTKALSHLSTLLGKDVTQSAIGAALAQSATLAAPASPVSAELVDLDDSIPGAEASGPVQFSEPVAQDAEFEELIPDAEPTPVAAAKPAATKAAQNADSILDELDAL